MGPGQSLSDCQIGRHVRTSFHHEDGFSPVFLKIYLIIYPLCNQEDPTVIQYLLYRVLVKMAAKSLKVTNRKACTYRKQNTNVYFSTIVC